jgi:hypothetical protein
VFVSVVCKGLCWCEFRCLFTDSSDSVFHLRTHDAIKLFAPDGLSCVCVADDPGLPLVIKDGDQLSCMNVGQQVTHLTNLVDDHTCMAHYTHIHTHIRKYHTNNHTSNHSDNLYTTQINATQLLALN